MQMTDAIQTSTNTDVTEDEGMGEESMTVDEEAMVAEEVLYHNIVLISQPPHFLISQ